VLLPEGELERRRAAYVPPKIEHQSPWQEIFRSMVGQMSTGACLEPATLYLNIAEEKGTPRHSH
jgi:dihydroxyacid dehydratase/phosphogluconate dehydratase